MSLFSFVHGTALIVNIVLGFLVFWTAPRRRTYQAFLLMSGVIAAWLVSLGLALTAGSEAVAELRIRVSSAVAVFGPVAFNLMRLTISRPDRPWLGLLRDSRAWLVGSTIVAGLCFMPAFLSGVRLPPDLGEFTVPEALYGPAFILYNLYYVLSVAVLGFCFVRDTRAASGLQRVELQFIQLGSVAAIVSAVVTALVIPLATGSSQSARFASISIIFLDGIIAYGIATRRIMEVAVILRRATAYALLAIYVTTLYLVVWVAVHRLTLYTDIDAEFFAHLAAGIAAAFALAPAHGALQQFANRLFVTMKTVDVTDTLQAANRIQSSVLSRSELLSRYSELILKTFGADRIQILLRDRDEFVQAYPPNRQPLRIPLDHPLARTLRSSPEPIVSDLLQRRRSGEDDRQIAAFFNAQGAAVGVGVNPQADFGGILLVGPRLSGRFYGLPEQRALQVLSNQLAVGLENTELYTRLQDSAIYNDILLDHLVNGVIAISLEGTITICNREARRILDATSTPIVQQPVAVLPGPLRELFRATLDRGHGIRDVDVELHRSGADPIPLRAGTALFHSHTGKRLGALMVLSDLTAIRKLEGQVRRTDRLASLGTLSAGMAHEIKNPLVTLKTFTQLLPERYEDSDFRDTFSTLVGHEVKRIDSIVNQLLRFARPTKPSLKPMRLHDVLENTLRLTHQQLKQKSVSLTRDLQCPNAVILGDADLLVQAILNLLLNAMDAMESGGTLTVLTRIAEPGHAALQSRGTRFGESYLQLTIQDTGKGIAPDDLPHVFDPFFTTKSSGTGLGLSVAHGIITEHRGIIDVESQVGIGASFHLFFPLANEEVPA